MNLAQKQDEMVNKYQTPLGGVLVLFEFILAH